ncbi:MAG: nucleoside triphosphate pyrophosphohydrolase [Bacilli bacterium]|nr:nucleoside triphosphate pyrophosphohydrolase [Bacilli bacterium]
MAKVIYDKLVRDNIPTIIENAGKTCVTKIVSNDEVINYLIKKAHEEIDELAEAKSSEEMADVLEVISAIIEKLGLDTKEVEDIQRKKALKNGAFKENIILLEVEDK